MFRQTSEIEANRAWMDFCYLASGAAHRWKNRWIRLYILTVSDLLDHFGDLRIFIIVEVSTPNNKLTNTLKCVRISN